MTDVQIPSQIQVQVKTQPVAISASQQNQLSSQIAQSLQPAFHTQLPIAVSQPQASLQQQTVTLVRPAAECPQQRHTAHSLNSFVAPAAISTATPLATFSLPSNRVNPATSKALTSTVSKASGSAGTGGTKAQTPVQSASGLPSENLQDKLAEQENHVHQRIAELRKEGLWSLRRLPKLQEASRPKSHWDYLLEEMQWMAADFAQERMWKVASAKKLVRTAARHHEVKRVSSEQAKKEEENKLKRIAASIAREIEYFWSNIEMHALNAKSVMLFLHNLCNEICFCLVITFTLHYMLYALYVLFPTIITADLPLNDLVKNYEGAYEKHFQRPHTFLKNEEGKPSSQGVYSPICVQVKTSPLALLHGCLRDYQQVGLEWMEKLYKQNLNGILADEPGLGKNVQVISLMARLACNEGNWGPHLFIVRSCKILKWELEFKRWCPGLKLLLYFGRQRELRKKRQKWEEPNSFNICITSYKQFFKGHQAFMKIRWKYLVMDEVHQIKNMIEKHWDAIFNLPSQNRLLLRDTLLQNTWRDHWNMLHFLIPGLSRPYLDFPVKGNGEDNQENCHKMFIMLHRVIRPFVLRRSKREVEKQLTKKYEHVLKCRLSNRQKALYEDVILQPGTQEALKGGHFVSVLHVLVQLQKICNHPELVDPRSEHFSYVSETLQYKTASLVLKALEYDPWKVNVMEICTTLLICICYFIVT
uniref:E1A binding protein p400 n=1 Tax=Leptobrachium leishanense TaxID=445787 RepID=A0A8C5QJ60_9ANUR